MIKFKPVLRSQQQFQSIQNLSYENQLNAQRHLCFYCDYHMPRDNITKDHLFPKSHGFHLRGNMVMAHKQCNGAKSNRYPTMTELVRWVKLNTKKSRQRLLIKVRNGKPVFKLILTEELIHDYLS